MDGKTLQINTLGIEPHNWVRPSRTKKKTGTLNKHETGSANLIKTHSSDHTNEKDATRK